MVFQLRPYQQAAIDSLYSYFQNNRQGNPLIVVPTAGGKSAIQGGFVKSIFERFPQHRQRVMLLTHVQELLEQNYERIKNFWPDADVGLYSAGLKRREVIFPITVAGIQSVYKRASEFGFVNIIMIDEAHLLSPESDSMYQRFIKDLKKYNENLKIIGMTATPFRTKGGLLTHGDKRIFTDISYEITIEYLLGANQEGPDGTGAHYIVPMRSKSAVTQADLKGVHKSSDGDFNQREAEEAIDQDPLTKAALDEVFALSEGRKAWLVFCQGVQHAFHIRDALIARGKTCEVITGETQRDERARIIDDFRKGRLDCVTNYGVLTTGFDAPNVDNLILLRATQSTSLYMQMLGRGMRLNGRTLDESIAKGKMDCQVLDFAGNLERFGPINMIQVRNTTSLSGRICEKCREVNSSRARVCFACGETIYTPELEEHFKTCPKCSNLILATAHRCNALMYTCLACDEYQLDHPEKELIYYRYAHPEAFNPEIHRCQNCNGILELIGDGTEDGTIKCDYQFRETKKHMATASTMEVIASTTDDMTHRMSVEYVDYRLHDKPGKAPMIRATYHCTDFNYIYNEYVSLGADGIPRSFAERWWNHHRRHDAPKHVPLSAEEGLTRINELREPAEIYVKKEGKYWRVVSVINWKPEQKPPDHIMKESEDIPF